MYKLDLENAEEPEIELPTSYWIIEKAREFQKNIYFYFIDYTKAFEVYFQFFKESPTLFSIVAVLVCIPTISVRRFPFLHTLSSIYYL